MLLFFSESKEDAASKGKMTKGGWLGGRCYVSHLYHKDNWTHAGHEPEDDNKDGVKPKQVACKRKL